MGLDKISSWHETVAGTVDYYDVIVANILSIANNGNRIEIIQKKKKVEVGEYLENIGKWKIYHARDKRLAV